MKKILLTTMLTGAAVAAASGKMTINGREIPLPHVYAATKADPFEPGKTMTYVLALDRELDASVRGDYRDIKNRFQDGELSGVEVELTATGFTWIVRCAEPRVRLLGQEQAGVFSLRAAGGRVQGAVDRSKPEKAGDTEYSFAFTVDAAIDRPPAAPTAADRAAARHAAPAKDYLIAFRAIQEGNKELLKTVVAPEQAAELDASDFAANVKIVREMMPKTVEVLRATETGDTAVLILDGDGGKQRGKIRMKRIGKRWTVDEEDWTAN